MLLKFTVQNYKGFGKAQTIDLVATPKNEYSESLIEINSSARVNSYSCVIGPNGSGKTHLLDSIKCCADAITDRKLKQIKPFILNNDFRTKPTMFEITLFDKDSNEFINYNFCIYKSQVVSEKLIVKKNEPFAKFKVIFERDGSNLAFTQEYKDLEEFISPNLDSGGLVSSFAASLKNNHLKFIYEWAQGVVLLNPRLIRNGGPGIVNGILNGLISEHYDPEIADPEHWDTFIKYHFREMLDKCSEKLKNFAIPIESMVIEQDETGNYYLTIKPESKTENQKAYTFSEAEEFFSEGTFNAICLTMIVELISYSDRLLLLDEIDGTFHHKLTRAVIDSIRNNVKMNQFIIATHDALLLDYKFRRDSIFTVTKDSDYFSIVERVSDHSIRKDARLSAKYFADEFGALPKIMEGDDTTEEEHS
ncbi:AAA family ATPase [Vibrio splendidus]|uniref:AAA family ATPase n=1 Tax=Vibrio splendidus TaxID=29497 RepID=UPI000D374DFE|nr:ATP-binding protein [Vibrio splendidus]PTO51564.1 hypothetical protein CWN82_23170 [Vibrio splendidus]